MIVAVFPIVIALVGLLVWFLSSNPKVSEAGKLAFFAGLLALSFALAGHTVRIG